MCEFFNQLLNIGALLYSNLKTFSRCLLYKGIREARQTLERALQDLLVVDSAVSDRHRQWLECCRAVLCRRRTFFSISGR